MKMFGITLFIFFMIVLSLIIIDLFSGMGFADALYSLGKSLWIIKPQEYVIILILVLFIIAQQIALHLKNRDGN
ncbi:hypothetical protein AB1K84_18440 [Mesobacillus foraminis]|uniref:hypothetical protein n=1 Tax=Mesobacillus foraminis TaxID=279826 RepID=UPI0039A235EB